MATGFDKIQVNAPTVPELVLDSPLRAIENGSIQIGRELPPPSGSWPRRSASPAIPCASACPS